MKNVLIRTDEFSIENTKKAILKKLELLNEFVTITENTLKLKLTDEQKTKLKEKGMLFVMDIVKPKFQFPDADTDFNLKALGIDLKPIQDFWDTNNKLFASLTNLEFNNGRFVINNIDELQSIKKHYYYATNERQIQAFKNANKVCKTLNDLLDKQLIKGAPSKLCNNFENIRYGSKSNRTGTREPLRFYPKTVAILNIR